MTGEMRDVSGKMTGKNQMSEMSEMSEKSELSLRNEQDQ